MYDRVAILNLVYCMALLRMRVNPKNTVAKTPHAETFGGAANEVENWPQVTSVVLYFVRVRISPYKPPW
jgi:hypothetical protein